MDFLPSPFDSIYKRFRPQQLKIIRLTQAVVKLDTYNPNNPNGSFVRGDREAFESVGDRNPELRVDLVDLALSPQVLTPFETVSKKVEASISVNWGLQDETGLAEKEISIFGKLHQMDLLGAGFEGDHDWLTQSISQQQKRLLDYIEENPENLPLGNFPQLYFERIIAEDHEVQQFSDKFNGNRFSSYDHLYKALSIPRFWTRFKQHEKEINQTNDTPPGPLDRKTLEGAARAKSDYHQKFTKGINPEFIKSICNYRLKKLIQKLLKCSNYEEAFEAINSDEVKEEILLAVADAKANPETPLEEVAERHKELEVKIWNGGPKSQENFGEDEWEMISSHFDKIYKNYPKWKKVLTAKIKEDLRDPNTRFYLIHHKGKPVAIRKITTIDSNKKIYTAGTFYINEPFKGFGTLLENRTFADLPPDASILGSVMPESPALERYTENGRIVTGVTRDTAIDQDSGEKLESEDLIQVITRLNGTGYDSSNLPRSQVLTHQSKTTIPKEKIVEAIKKIANNGLICTRLCWEGDKVHLITENRSSTRSVEA